MAKRDELCGNNFGCYGAGAYRAKLVTISMRGARKSGYMAIGDVRQTDEGVRNVSGPGRLARAWRGGA